MAQTVEELAELLDNIKLEVERNMDGFDKVLNTINNKLDLISNDTEADDLIKVYLTELKKLLEERHALISEEFTNIKNSSQTIISEQSNMVKTSQMQDMFDIFTTNMQSVAQELFTQRELLAQYEEKFSQYTSDKTDKKDIISSVSAIKKDIDVINEGFSVAIAEIGSNIQSIYKNLIVMDPSAQNDIVKRELENIYLSSNAILSALHSVEQKNDDIIQYFDNLITKEEFKQSQEKLDNILHNTNTLYEKLPAFPDKNDLNEINKSIDVFSDILDKLRDSLSTSNENLNTFVNNQLNELNFSLASVVTEQDFAGFRSDLGDFIQKIVENSSVLNENLNLNKATLEELITKIQNLDINKNLEEITDMFGQIQSDTQSNTEKIITSIANVSSRLDNIPIESIEDKIDYINEKVIITSQDLKVLQDKFIENLNKEQPEYFEKINHNIELLQETITSNKEEVSLIEKLVALRDMINENAGLNAQDLNDIKNKLTENIENINKITQDTDEKLSTSYAEIAEMKADVSKIIDQVTEFNTNQEQRDTKFVAMLSSELNELSVAIETLQTSIQSGLHQEFAHNAENVEKQINTVILEIENLKKEVDRGEEQEYFDNAFKEIKDKITAVKQEVNLVNTDVFDIITSKTEALMMEIAPIKSILNLLEDIKNNTTITSSDENLNNQDFELLIKQINEMLDNSNSLMINTWQEKIFQTNDILKNEIEEKIDSATEDLKNTISLTFNTEFLTQNNSKIEEQLQSLNEKVDILAVTENSQNNSEVFEKIASNNSKIEEQLQSLNEKVDILAVTENSQNNSEFFEKIASNNSKIEEQLQSLNEKVDVIASVDYSENNFEIIDNITDGNNKISQLLDVLNQKVDILAMSDYSEDNSEILEEINDIKTMISSQRNLLEKSVNSGNANAIEERLEELIAKINSTDTTLGIKEVRESLLTTILNVFEQISFIEESEDIKDFVEEKTEAINQSLIEVKQQLKQITNNDDGYSYTLQDVESDIAKLRLVIKEFSNTTSTEEISDISDNIHRIVSSVENIQTSLTQEQVSYLRENFERLSEDVLSISSRTNKLLLTSDESYNALNNGLNDFSNVICKLEERLNYLDNKEITERIEQKLDNTLSLVTEASNSDKVMRQALIYMGEWIDNASENIQCLCEQSEKIESIQEVLKNYENKIQDQAEIINSISERFEEQQERMDRLELTLEKILSAIEDIDDTKLQKKVDKLDKQLTQLSSSIEKLTSYVDE